MLSCVSFSTVVLLESVYGRDSKTTARCHSHPVGWAVARASSAATEYERHTAKKTEAFVHIGQERHNPNNQRMPFDGFITSENIDWDKKPNKTDTAEALRAVNPKVKVIAA